MDTDDLSIQTYKAVLSTAESLHHDLTLPFGLLADSCNNDDEFLDASESLIKEWLTDWEIDEAMLEIFYDDPPDRKTFTATLDKILKNIRTVRKTPMSKRKYEEW